MFQKKALVTAMAAAMVIGASLSGNAHAVSLSDESGVGQVLLGAQYLARSADYNTSRLTVVNSSLTNAVKARIALRSKKHSDECFDIVANLSPGDVAYLDIRLNAAGQPEVWSDDDSFIATRDTAGNIKFASQISGGQVYPITAPRTEPAADSCAQGHLEVIGVYAASGTVNVPVGAPVVVKQGMSKFDLVRIFDTAKSGSASSLNALNTTQVTNNPSNGADAATRIRLKGDVTTSSSSDRIRIPLTALRGDATQYLITNSALDTSVGGELQIGSGFYDPLTTGGLTDALNDIEAALNTNRLFNTYKQGGTTFEVTFPTKYRHINTGRYSGNGATYLAPFNVDGSVRYTASLFDNQENSAPVSISNVCIVSPCVTSTVASNYLIHEVNYTALTGTSSWDPASGWFDLGLFGLNNVAVPAIGFTHYMGNAGAMNSVTAPFGR